MEPTIQKLLKNIEQHDREGVELFKKCTNMDLQKIKLVCILDFQLITTATSTRFLSQPTTLCLFTFFHKEEYAPLWRSLVIMSILYVKSIHLNLVFVFVGDRPREIENENIIKKSKTFLFICVHDIASLHSYKTKLNDHLGMHKIDF